MFPSEKQKSGQRWYLQASNSERAGVAEGGNIMNQDDLK